jgi:hypothetical protein
MAAANKTVRSMGFVIAVQACFTTAPYDEPWRTMSQVDEWLIVSCWGAKGEFLTISHTGRDCDGNEPAPPGLRPTSTYLGLLLSRSDSGDGGGALARENHYLIIRHLSEARPVAGIFLPSDGYARISITGTEVSLQAGGRLAHSLGARRGREIRRDVPDPAPDATSTTAWHIRGTRCPWMGEFFTQPTLSVDTDDRS